MPIEAPADTPVPGLNLPGMAHLEFRAVLLLIFMAVLVCASALYVMYSRGAFEPTQRLVLVGTAASRFTVAPVPPELHLRSLVIHGEQDDTVPLASVMDWARPQTLPVLVVPGGGHFFHGQLPMLRELVLRHLRS